MALAPRSCIIIFSDNTHWILSVFGAMKDAKISIGNAFCSVAELRLNDGVSEKSQPYHEPMT